MPDVLVRNLSEEAVAALKRRAARHRRSLQQELCLVLEGISREEEETLDPLAAARELRERLRASGRVFSDSTELIREDRDSR